MKHDFLIIGAGIAGLYAAMNIPKDKDVVVISKDEPWECNSFYAQGGIASAINDADIPLHCEDTQTAGAGVCDEEAIQILSASSQEVIQDLVTRGFAFDTDQKGNLLYTKEAAHSTNRILHAGGDATGRELHLFLLEQNPHKYVKNAVVVDLLIEKNCCYGVCIFDGKEFRNLYADNIILASGGVGSLFTLHTNSRSISSDIHGLCELKGIALEAMEMLQFHPTVYVNAKGIRKLLLTEALRGEGAQVVNAQGEAFLKEYHDDAELAPRDIVSRAIFDYANKKGDVFLSFQNFSKEYLKNRFPTVYSSLTQLGFNLPKDLVPISPAFHYCIGGIKTDLEGRVLGFENLYAVGEVASTGVHGANRLASNSLLEAFVFSKRATQNALCKKGKINKKSFTITCSKLELPADKAIKDELRSLMWRNVGIVRTQEGLRKTLSFIEDALTKPLGRLLYLRLLTAKKIVESALQRKEPIGVHYIVNEES